MLEFPEHAKSKLPDHQDARKPEQNVARSYIKGWALERPPLAEATWHHAVSRVATLIWEDAETQAMHPLPRLLAHPQCRDTTTRHLMNRERPRKNPQ